MDTVRSGPGPGRPRHVCATLVTKKQRDKKKGRRPSMQRTLIVLSLVAALLGSVAAPSLAVCVTAATTAAPVASDPLTRPAFLDRTRFLLHAGVAFFIVHHEYKRYREGYFRAGTPGRVRHIVVAAAALALAYHEAHVAYRIAEGSHSRTLHALAAPLAALSGGLSAATARLRGGRLTPSDFSGLNGATGRINSTASSTGFGAIPDRSIALPAGA